MKSVKKALNIREAAKDFEKYVEIAKSGKTVYMGRYGRPEVKLVVVNSKRKETA